MPGERDTRHVCLNWGFASPSTLYRSFWRRCFQLCGTFTRHWNEMTSQALPPNETNRVYIHVWSDSHHFAWAGLDLLRSLPVLVRSVSALRGSTMQPNLFLLAPAMDGGPHETCDNHFIIPYFLHQNLALIRVLQNTCNTGIWRFKYPLNITKACLYNFDPLKPHFYIVKLGFTGVYIIFLISVQKHRLWVLFRTASARQF